MADLQSLADILRTLAADHDLRAAMSRAARERALRNTKSLWNRLRFDRILEEFTPEEIHPA